MRKLLSGLLCACLALGCIGCTAQPNDIPSSPQTTADQAIIDSNAQETDLTKISMHALALPTVQEEITGDDDTLIFSLSYQVPQVTLSSPILSSVITHDLQTRIESITAEADTICDEARADQPDAMPWSNYFLNLTYTPTRLDQTVLSLFGNQVTYRGGAHPYVITNSVTYDLQNGNVLTLDDIFCEGYSREVLLSMVLKALEGKAEELSFDYRDTLTQRFSEADAAEDDWYFSKTGLCFHFSPYEIAPYSSGTIIAEISYEDLTDLLRPQYLPGAGSDSIGSMYAEPFDPEATQRFPLIADLNLSEEADPVILYADATVTDLRIEIGTLLEDNSTFLTTGVLFVADSIGIGEAIRLAVDLSSVEGQLRLVYRSGEGEVSSLICQDDVGSILLSSN